MKTRLLLILLLVAAIGFCAPRAVLADDVSGPSGSSIVEQIGCDITTTSNTGTITVNRACQITDFINLFIYLSKWAMSILAMLATLMIIYGGFQFVTAGGRASKIDEGKRVILGTVVGTIIALTGYIIINTAFAAITGTKIASNNPFGVVSSVFKDRSAVINGQTVPLVRPFTGSTPNSGGSTGGNTSNLAACRQSGSTWDFTCSAGNLQVHCADPATGATPIVSIQTKLEAKGCFCGGHDGCYGPQTVQCVRQFQIANKLPPTGVVDATTQDRIDNGTVRCTSEAASLAARLPETELSTTAGDGQGCCVIKSGGNDLYCVDSVTPRACGALGAENQFVSGKCGLATGTVGKCGFCSSTSTPSTSSSSCFSYASPYWCTNGGTASTFNFGACDGRCQTCVHSLLPGF